jgi:hypothetical protein
MLQPREHDHKQGEWFGETYLQDHRITGYFRRRMDIKQRKTREPPLVLKQPKVVLLESWSGKRDLNPRPSPWQGIRK